MKLHLISGHNTGIIFTGYVFTHQHILDISSISFFSRLKFIIVFLINTDMGAY